jgi:hypothetical protein
LLIVQFVSTAFVIVELVIVDPDSVELARVTPVRFTFVSVQGRVRVELVMVEVPLIPRAEDEATEGAYEA